MVKNNSPTCGFAARGGIIFHHACEAIRGEWDCAFRDSWGIFNSPTRGFATRRGILNFPTRGFAARREISRPQFSSEEVWVRPNNLQLLSELLNTLFKNPRNESKNSP